MIVGGIDKETIIITNTFSQSKVKAIVCLGESRLYKAAFENLDVDIICLIYGRSRQLYEHATKGDAVVIASMLVLIYSKIMSTEVMNLNHQ